MKKVVLILGLLSSVFIGVNAQSDAVSFTNASEKAHQKSLFYSKRILTYDISILFGDAAYLKAKITQTVGGDKIKVEKEDGSIILFDGNEVVASGIPKDKIAGARFDIFTWPYFIGLPYKLNDKGTVWSEFTQKPFYKKIYNTAKLSFQSGTGDAPDDWYVVYQNPTTKLIEGAAYIVSFGKGKEAAEKEPHAVKFDRFISVDGVPFPTSWTYHMWTKENGFGTQIGEAYLDNILFLEEADFSKPVGAVKVVAP